MVITAQSRRIWAANLACLALLLLGQPVSAQTPPAPVPTTQAAPATIPSVEAFAQLPFVERAAISPDGSRMAGMFASDGQQIIAIYNMLNNGERMTKAVLPDGMQVNWLRWVNDDNIIVGVRALIPVDGGERWYVSRTFAINRQSGEIKRLLWDRLGQNAADLLWIANDGSPEVLIAAQNSAYLGDEFWPTVWRVNVETGSKRIAQRPRSSVMNWSTDGLGNVRAGVRYDDRSRSSTLFYRGEDLSNYRVIDRANGRQREELFNPVLFVPGTNHALTIHDDDAGVSGIYEVDLLTLDDVRLVHAAPSGSEFDRIVVSKDESTLLGAGTTAAGSGMHWFDPALAALQTQFDQSVGAGRNARIISLSRDQKRMLVIVDRPNSPGALYFYDVLDGRLQRLASINEALGQRVLSPVRMIRYTARDGTEIEAVLTLPQGRDPRGLPLVMMPHGGPWGQDSLGYDYWAQFIASRGYAVLQPNFRGSTGYGEAFLRKGEGQMGLAMQDDITDGLRWAVTEGIADPARACIVGASYGGYAAMWGIAKDPGLYRCAISISGVANIRGTVNDFGDGLYGGAARDSWGRMTPDFAAVSPINAVARITAPLLLVHGRRDITVDHDQSSQMASRMREAGKAVEFVSLPLADHYFTRQEDRVRLLSEIERFLAAHNPAGPPAQAGTSPSTP